MKQKWLIALCAVLLCVLFPIIIVTSVKNMRDNEAVAVDAEVSEKAVTITMQPKNITVKKGGVAEVTVKAIGEGLRYAWYVKDSDEVSFTKSGLFTENSCRTEINDDNAGRQLYCEITDKYGNTVTSNIVTVNMSNVIKIVEQPKAAVVKKGETAKVAVEAVGDGLRYRWYYKNADALSFEKTNSFTGNTYEVKMDEKRTDRQIYCVITDRYGHSITSDVVTIFMGNVAEIFVQPKNIMAAKGEIAEVSVDAVGDGLTYAWYYKNADASSFEKTDSSVDKTYAVKMSKARKDRQVYCVITDRYGNSVTTDIVTLAMGNVAKILEQPQSLVVEEGENAKVTFLASGDGLTYAWYARNAGDYFYRKTSSFSGNAYWVEMNTERAGRQVYCVVTDQYGNTVTTDTVTLEMPLSDTGYPDVYDKLSWDKISAFPIASEGMTLDERRKLCVDFFRFSKTFAWTPSEDLIFVRNMQGLKDTVHEGKVYGGFPYVTLGSGNVYRLIDCMDTRTGILDVSKIEKSPELFFNQCSLSTYWAWGRVVNSARYDYTYNMVQARGFLPVGSYTYDADVRDFRFGTSTQNICLDNGRQTMYESYACLLPADGLVKYSETGGHVIMCSAKAEVVRNADGTIDGDKSFIYFIDQSQKWELSKQSNGNFYNVKSNIDFRKTFSEMFLGCYIPFTFAEFLGTDPVEALEYRFSHTEESITAAQLREAEVEANYGLSDIYALVKDKNGNVLYTAVKRMESANVLCMSLMDAIDQKRIQKYTNGKYTVEVQAQFANGERHILYTGVLTE